MNPVPRLWVCLRLSLLLVLSYASRARPRRGFDNACARDETPISDRLDRRRAVSDGTACWLGRDLG